MRNLLRLAMVIFTMSFANLSQAQTYCTYSIGFSGCWTGATGSAIDDITFGAFTELNSGCNSGVYNYQPTKTITVAKGSAIPFTLATTGGSVQWGIWVDANADGDFTDAADIFWGSSSNSSSVSGTFLIPSSVAVASTRIRFKTTDGTVAFSKADACSWPLSTETQDFPLNLTAAGGCSVPTTLNAFPTSVSAFLSWDSVGTQYNVEHGLTGFTPGSGTTINPVTDTVTISGLTPKTYYDFYVQNDCSAASSGDSSNWNGPFTFVTSCTPTTTFPYLEGFEGSDWAANSGNIFLDDTISTCWDRYPIFNYNYAWLVRTGGTNSNNTGPIGAYAGNNYMYVEMYGSPGDEAIFTSPQFNTNSLVAPWLSFRFHMYGVNIGNLYTEVSTNGGLNWTVIDSLTGQQQIADVSGWLERGTDVTPYKGSEFMFRLRAKHMGGYTTGDIAIDNVELGEAPACKKVSNFKITNINGSSADANWNSTESKFFLEIGVSGFTQGTGAIDTVTTNSHSFSNLAGNTYWDVYINTDCSSSGNGYSSWSGPYSFRTLIRPDWVEDFDDGFVPNSRWERSKGLISNPTVLTGTYSGWGQDGWLNPPSIYKGAVRCNISKYNGDVKEWFFTESIDLGTGVNYEIYFDMAATVGGGSGSVALEADDVIKFVVSTDNGLTWNDSNTVFTVDQTTGLSNVGGTYTASLAGYSGVVKIGVYCESTVANITSTDIFIDNFGVRLPSQCPDASALKAWNISYDQLTLGWTSSALADTFEIEYGPTGFGQGTGMLVSNITADSAIVNGLNAATQYDFYVISHCGNFMSVAGPLTVYTGCPPVFTTPYFESFDGLSAGNPPVSGIWDNCWKTESGSNSVYRWQTSKGANSWSQTGPSADHTQNVAGEGVYFYTEASNNGIETFLENGPFDLSTLTTPTLSFFYHMYGSQMGSLHIDISTDMMNWNKDAFVVSGEQHSAAGDPWLKANLALSQYVNDTIYIRIRGVKGYGTNGDMAVDDISIRNHVGCIAPSGLTSGNRTATTIDLTWGTYESPSTIEWGVSGFKQASGATSYIVNGITNSNHSLTGLTSNTAYDYYVKDTCSSPNVWVGPHTFFTDCAGALSGVYTIGGIPGANNFPTIVDAVSSLTNCGVSGAVTFNLAGISHKDSTLAFENIPGASAVNTVTFNGSGTDSLVVSGKNTIEFDGTGFVTLNNLYVINYAGTNAIWLHNGAHDISIENCIVEGSSTSSTSATISASLVPNNTSVQGQNSFNINVSNNTISGAYNGVAIYGNQNIHTHGLTVVNNTFNVENTGIRVYGVDSVELRDNYMYDTPSLYGGTGAYLYYVNEFEISSNYFAGKNQGLALTNCNVDSVSTNSTIVNNMLFGLKSGNGMQITNARQVDIFHNSINSKGYGIYLNQYTGFDGNHIDVRNNIFVSTNDYALYNRYTGADVKFNYNIYHSDHSTRFVYDNGSPYGDLPAWKLGNTSENANSIENTPGYLSSDDLHIISVVPNDVGDNTVNVTMDIDGDSRPMSPSTTVDIGADEFTPKAIDVSLEKVLRPNSGCGDSLTDVILLIRNLGSTVLTSTPLTVNVTGDVMATLNYTYTGSLLNLEYDTVNVGSFNSIAGGINVNVEAYATLANDEDSSNDTLMNNGMFFIPDMPNYYAADTACSNSLDSITLAAESYPGVEYAWYAKANDTIATAIGDSFKTTLVNQKSWYLGYLDKVKDSLNSIGFTSTWGGTGGLMFDLTGKSNIEITKFDLNSRVNAGDTGTFTIYYIEDGTYVGNETDASKWTSHETISYVSAGTGFVSTVNLTTPLSMPYGVKYGIYLEYSANWTTGSIYTEVQNSALLKFEGGEGLHASFGSLSTNRIFDGVIYANSVVCSDTRVMVTIPINPDTAVASFTHVVSLPNKVDVDASASKGQVIDWDFGDGSTGSGITASNTYGMGGDYTVTCVVTDTVCNTTDTMVTVVNMTIGIDESALAQSLNVFPNPNNGSFNVSFDIEGNKNVTIKVLNAVGSEVYVLEAGKVSDSYEARIDLSSSSEGMYIVQIVTDDNVVSKKVVIQ